MHDIRLLLLNNIYCHSEGANPVPFLAGRLKNPCGDLVGFPLSGAWLGVYPERSEGIGFELAQHGKMEHTYVAVDTCTWS